MGLVGLAGHLVTVEAHIADGLPSFVVSGLPDAALTEARDRVRAAIVNSGERWPQCRITINLLPADLPKHGSAFDLAIAAVLLGGSGQLPSAGLDRAIVIGELGLDGRVRPVRGVLPMLLAAARAGVHRAIVPAANAGEATLVPGVTVRAADTLCDVISFARGAGPLLTASAGGRMRRDDPGPTFPTSSGRSVAGSPSNSPPPVGITSPSSAHPAPARPCSRSVCRRSCRLSTTPPRSR